MRILMRFSFIQKSVMIIISKTIHLNSDEVHINAIRSQGAGGQHVNKVSSAIHLRFDILASSLSDRHKQQLLESKDSRVNKEGVFIIKAQQYRTQERNKVDAFERLQQFIIAATHVQKPRKPTKPSKNARHKRMDKKTKRGQTKVLRGKVDF